MRLAWILPLVLASGCAHPADCEVEAGMDGGVPFDAAPAIGDAPIRWDAQVPFDSPSSCFTALYLMPTIVEGPSEFRSCLGDATRPLRVHIVRASDGAVVYDVTGTCDSVGPGLVADGRYLISLESGPYAVGARLLHPEHCTDDGADDPWCEPLILTVRRCEPRFAAINLFCDEATGACPDVRWPWERR